MPNKSGPKFTEETPWRSIGVIAALTMFSMLQFSIYFSSTYPFLLSLDPDVSEKFYGAVVASYSLGQIIGSPLFGWHSNRIKNVRSPIAIGLVFSFFGNLVYASSLIAPAGLAKYFVLLGRFIVGFGGSNVSVMRAFASMSSSSKDRSRAIALINGGYALGQTCGPAIQLIFTPIGFPGVQLFGPVFVSIYTAPAFASCIINILGLVCLYKFFTETYAGLVDTKCNKNSKSSDSTMYLPEYDILALSLCHVTTFAQRFTFTNLETLNPPLGMLMFLWKKADVVKYVGLAHGVVSFLTLLVNISYFLFKMEKFLFGFRIQSIVAVAGLFIFHLVTFSWPFLPGHLKTYTQSEYEFAILNGTEIVGCNSDKFTWCNIVKPTNVFVFYGAYVLFVGLCFPVMNITINVLFSKILGPRRMAAQQGFLQMTGSFARLAGPVTISNIYSEFGPQSAWLLEFIVLGVNLIMWIPLYKRMVPLNFLNETNSNLSTIKIQPIQSEKKLSLTSLESGKTSLSDRTSYNNTQRTTVE